MSAHGKVFERSSWNVERGNSTICGFSSSDAAHAQAKPRGFRTAGTVIRTDTTRSWIIDGDLTVETITHRRTVEPQRW